MKAFKGKYGSCHGVSGGWAINEVTNKKHHASRSTKSDGPFVCPVCRGNVVVRKCSEKVDHFAHSFINHEFDGANESALHMDCKESICSLLAEKFPGGRWESERYMPANKSREVGRLKPDISGRIFGKRVVIEVQASVLPIEEIERRTISYSKLGIAILWIIPLNNPLETGLFRPKKYERYLQNLYSGRTYYWWRGLGLFVVPIHFSIAKRFIKHDFMIVPDGEIEVGGYSAIYKYIKRPIFGRNIEISDDFFVEKNDIHNLPDINRFSFVPILWKDKLLNWWDG